MDNFRAHKKLKTSLQNFLKRVEQETSIGKIIFIFINY